MRRIVDRAVVLGGTRHARFCAASLSGVVATHVLLVLFVQILGWRPTTSNVIAVTVSCVPCFLLNRYWVWGATGTRNLGSQAVAFWGMALLGLALSTLIVSWLALVWTSPLVANVGNMVGFGTLWVAKYLVLDRVLFRPFVEPAPATP